MTKKSINSGTKNILRLFQANQPYFCPKNYEKIKYFLKSEFVDQIMISNNLNFKTQLKSYGSIGFTRLFELYFKRIIKDGLLTQRELKQVFSCNLQNVLGWWRPFKLQERERDTFVCRVCEKEKYVDQDPWTKNGKVYCSLKCLKHDN